MKTVSGIKRDEFYQSLKKINFVTPHCLVDYAAMAWHKEISRSTPLVTIPFIMHNYDFTILDFSGNKLIVEVKPSPLSQATHS